MANNENDQAEEPQQETLEGDEEIQDDEYIVEAIRAKRKNARTGLVEYLIKWQDYPESSNTWEPIEHLKCPDLILKFQEEEKNKRKRKSVTESQTKRTRGSKVTTEPATSSSNQEPLLVEDEHEHGSSTETLSSTASVNGDQAQEAPEPATPKPKGFERGLSLESIVASVTDEHDKLWFFVKWKGANELEVVDADELEEKAPRKMCGWYRERLYFTINNPTVA